MDFVTILIILVLIGLGLFYCVLKAKKKEVEKKHYFELLSANPEDELEFNDYWKNHSNFSLEYALTKFYSDPQKLLNAETELLASKEHRKEIQEKIKKVNIVNRVYAYQYEDFIFKEFSSIAKYNEYRKKWEIPYTESIIKTNFIQHMRNEYPDCLDIRSLFSDFIKHDLISLRKDEHNHIRIGTTLTFNSHIISEYDMDFDKWKNKNEEELSGK